MSTCAGRSRSRAGARMRVARGPLVAIQPLHMHPYSVAKTVTSLASLSRPSGVSQHLIFVCTSAHRGERALLRVEAEHAANRAFTRGPSAPGRYYFPGV